jgi:hypothetical protein
MHQAALQGPLTGAIASAPGFVVVRDWRSCKSSSSSMIARIAPSLRPLVGLLGVAVAANAQTLDTRALPREVADEVMALYNAPQTQRVEGRHEVARETRLETDLAVLDGPLVVAGTVAGRVVAINADVVLEPGARIDGDVLVVGGRVTGRADATITGSVRVYAPRLRYARDGDRLTTREREDRWWRRRERWADGRWSELRLVSARTYNRVEGLPVLLGPAFGREFDWGRVSVEAYGVLRSNDSFDWNSENLGHSATVQLDLGRRGGLRLGARHFDVVESVEPWQLSDSEAGLASFFLHRDFRDYYNAHGGTVSASLFRRGNFDTGVSWSEQRWGARPTRDPWTLFRDDAAWRANPTMDGGKFRLWNATVRFDTRNDPRNPWSGWHLAADYEYGTGTTTSYAPGTAGRLPTVGGATTYDRLFLDLRRYNRVSPNGQLNVRVVMGGWLSGDPLPMQRRFSLGGPGTMPGYRFRNRAGGRSHGSDVDYWHCSSPAGAPALAVLGVPGECERFALGQVEFRGDLDLDPFGIFDEERHWRRRGWGRSTQFVLFADAGRGWLVGTADQARTLGKSQFPKLSSFQTDVGAGLVFDDLGLYVAKAVSQPDLAPNFIIRLRSRF